MKRKLFIVLTVAVLLLSACSAHSQPDEHTKEPMLESSSPVESSSQLDDRPKEPLPENQSPFEKRCETFIENFSYDYPEFELLEYVFGSDENNPIQLAAIALNKKTGSSSTLFILDKDGVGLVVLASDQMAYYRPEDGLRLDQNVICISLDLCDLTISEIHDFRLTVTKEDYQGAVNTAYASQETIRNVQD